MNVVSRKKFILSGLSLIPLSFILPAEKEESLKLSFSTLGCPDWTFEHILSFANQHGYSGIEVRGILREMDLTKVPEFSAQQIADTLRKMKDQNLAFTDLGSSAAMHFPKETSVLPESHSEIIYKKDLKYTYCQVYGKRSIKRIMTFGERGIVK